MSEKRCQLGIATVFLVVIGALVISSGCRSHLGGPSLLDRAETARAAAANPANYGRLVRVTGVVTYLDPDWHLLFMQDESGGFFVNLPGDVPDLAVGRLVELSGKLAPSSRGVDNPRFRVLGQGPMPAPQRLPDETDPTTARLSQWVQCRGTIRRASIEDGRLTLTIADSGGRRTRVRVLDAAKARPITLVGVPVVVAGVSGASVDARGNPTGIQIFASSIAQVKPIDARGFTDPFTTKPQPFSMANDRNDAGSLVHLAGTALELRPGRFLVIGDGSTRVTAQLSDSYQPGPGDAVELLGFVSSSPVNLEDAIVRVVAPRTPLKESQINGALKTVRELKSLSIESAAKSLPVVISGIVTFFDPSSSLLFVQDATGGVYVDVHNGIPDVVVGDHVRVRGFSGPGDYAPIIASPAIVRIGHGSMPNPLPLSWQTLASGKDDAGWVEIAGLVHSVSQLRTQRWFKLVVAGNSYTVQLPHSELADASPESLLDTQVRIRGVCGAVFNENRQLVGLRFFVPSMKYIQVVESAPPESAMETRPIVSLLRFDPLNISSHRTKVRGTVTFVDGERGFYLQDSTAGIYVVPNEKQQIHAGQSVEVAGFAVAGPDGPHLEDAGVHVTEPPSRVSPTFLTADDLANGSYQSRLVSVRGRLLEQVSSTEEDTLFLRVRSVVLRASLQDPHLSEEFRRSSVLEVTGILHTDEGGNQDSYRIFVPSASNVRLIEAASWWTPDHIIRTLILALILLLAVLLWMAFRAYRLRSYQAEHDLLTGLPNRRSVLEYLDRQLARAMRERKGLGVILADVDHFKKVNDSYGHQAGDAVLRRLAEILRVELRPYDAVGRFGGEEFLIVIPGCDSETAREIANRIRLHILAEPFASVLCQEHFHVTCSFGIAISDGATLSVESLLASADRALYAAKGSGRNKAVRVEDLFRTASVSATTTRSIGASAGASE